MSTRALRNREHVVSNATHMLVRGKDSDVLARDQRNWSAETIGRFA